MEKRIRSVVPDTQQLIETWIERIDGRFTVEMRACSALDQDLRSQFHADVSTLATTAVVVHSDVRESLEGNEIGQTVVVSFDDDDQLEAVRIIRAVAQLGTEYYERQLEREMDRDEPGWKHHDQQRRFHSDEMERFCLLYRAAVDG